MVMRMRNTKSCGNQVLSGIIVYRATSIRVNVKVSMYYYQHSFRFNRGGATCVALLHNSQFFQLRSIGYNDLKTTYFPTLHVSSQTSLLLHSHTKSLTAKRAYDLLAIDLSVGSRENSSSTIQFPSPPIISILGPLDQFNPIPSRE